MRMRSPLLILTLLVVAGSTAVRAQWSEAVEVRRGDLLAVTYRARLEGGRLLVEARHEPGWHTYAMDNVERARAASGKEEPETELPTRIEVEGGLRRTGPWSQTEPIDLSQPALRWYTWGFEGTSHFAAEVEAAAESPGVVHVDGQACTESQCLWVDDLVLEVPVPARPDDSIEPPSSAVDLSSLVPVREPGDRSSSP